MTEKIYEQFAGLAEYMKYMTAGRPGISHKVAY